MNAYVSTELSMIQMLDPQRHELALLQEAFLNKGGTIEVLQGPSFRPPPIRHESPPQKKTAKPKSGPEAAAPVWLDKMAQRDIEREERAKERAKERVELVDRIRKLAETMCYAQAILRTGMSRRSLQKIAVDGGFTFQPVISKGRANLKVKTIDEAKDAKDAERIRAFMEIGLSRNQAMTQVGLSFKTFARILAKFDIDYPKRRAGPHPAFFAKQG
ncbi:hypothetical protein C9422_18540 [Pseudomonas sp. B1(2018)]|uniref:hypothetical protein n=1 Tax=Pseudomonas sp. B1(2018) TaxID=2233856 RepID=UPI000D5DB2D5|nr:hypothetical protein [Pseudomonas sp. B1(2018)]PVZ56522.1 hypothetical protein C9422_18540 [Pseudomonas sp. B1(2018)]